MLRAVDISSQAVAAARARHLRHKSGLRFALGDARSLAELSESYYGAVLDKGTLDAICCGDGFDWEAKRVAEAVAQDLSLPLESLAPAQLL